MLTVLEEIVLLTVDEKTGKLRSPKNYATANALAGALFFDLALAKKIDTDTENIQLIDSTPVGNSVTDYFLKQISEQKDLTTVRDWIEEGFQHSQYLEEEALRSMVDRGILKHQIEKKLWVIDVDRLRVIDHHEYQEVKLRLAQTILSDVIPGTRDIMLVSLASACGLLGYVLNEHEIEARKDRIQTIMNLETISRQVVEAIADREQQIYTAINSSF
ncbi:MAG: GPP34 family phosphoprotein [Bryobacteraceae bacterium]